LHFSFVDISTHLEEHVKKIRIGIIVICLALLALAFACTGGDTIKTMQLGEAVSLKINESAKLATNDLLVTFKAVTSDSRCRQGAQCVWAGEANVVLTVKAGENSQDITVKVGAGADNKAAFAPYVIRILKLDPYPVLNQSIQDSDRVIEMRVDRTED
jgi:hypothetical protein